jgi:hypothetical protein
MSYSCFACGYSSQAPVRYPCPSCGLSLDHLDGTAASTFQTQKWNEHTDLVSGNSVGLYGKDWNCSFDSTGYSKISDLVEFTINYGQKLHLPSNRGNHTNDVMVAFIPEIIGSGVSTHYATLSNQPCSGCCVISPSSVQFGHSFPVLHDWVSQTWQGNQTNCRRCNKSTHVGLTICWECYQALGEDWTQLLKTGF